MHAKNRICALINVWKKPGQHRCTIAGAALCCGSVYRQRKAIYWSPSRVSWQSAPPHFWPVYRKPPLQLPDLPVNLFWHRRYHQDPGNQWLRQLIVETFTEL
jgi:DNA-binding transcriptional LysR family regulator